MTGSGVSQGRGVEDFRDDIFGNAWLQRPQVLREGEYIEALKLRSNTTGVATNLCRVGKRNSANCRICNSRPETQVHVLCECVATKPQRIRRHDDVVAEVSNKIKDAFYMNVIYKEETLLRMPARDCAPTSSM
jgi:hypothetical protein